jgi:hypothetical protein
MHASISSRSLDLAFVPTPSIQGAVVVAIRSHQHGRTRAAVRSWRPSLRHQTPSTKGCCREYYPLHDSRLTMLWTPFHRCVQIETLMAWISPEAKISRAEEGRYIFAPNFYRTYRYSPGLSMSIAATYSIVELRSNTALFECVQSIATTWSIAFFYHPIIITMTTQLAMHNPEETHLMQTGAVEEAMEVRGVIGCDGTVAMVAAIIRFLPPQC